MNHYLKELWQKIIPEENGRSRKDYCKDKLIAAGKYGVFALAAAALLRGILVLAGADITVSNSVNGRELPIYCVETSEKKIALTFDAAWGNTR